MVSFRDKLLEELLDPNLRWDEPDTVTSALRRELVGLEPVRGRATLSQISTPTRCVRVDTIHNTRVVVLVAVTVDGIEFFDEIVAMRSGELPGRAVLSLPAGSDSCPAGGVVLVKDQFAAVGNLDAESVAAVTTAAAFVSLGPMSNAQTAGDRYNQRPTPPSG